VIPRAEDHRQSDCGEGIRRHGITAITVQPKCRILRFRHIPLPLKATAQPESTASARAQGSAQTPEPAGERCEAQSVQQDRAELEERRKAGDLSLRCVALHAPSSSSFPIAGWKCPPHTARMHSRDYIFRLASFLSVGASLALPTATQ